MQSHFMCVLSSAATCKITMYLIHASDPAADHRELLKRARCSSMPACLLLMGRSHPSQVLPPQPLPTIPPFQTPFSIPPSAAAATASCPAATPATVPAPTRGLLQPSNKLQHHFHTWLTISPAPALSGGFSFVQLAAAHQPKRQNPS